MPRGANIVTMRFVIVLGLFVGPLFSSLFAQTCTYVVTPNVFNIAADTFTGSVTVTTAPGSTCDGNFLATTTVPWLHLTSQSAYTLGVPITFTADANQGAAARSGLMQI